MDVPLGKTRETLLSQASNPIKTTRSLYPSRSARTASSSNSPKELITFLSRERFPLSGDDSLKRNVYNPDTVQGENPIPQDLAHAPNLSIASFGKNDTESCWTKSFYLAGLG